MQRIKALKNFEDLSQNTVMFGIVESNPLSADGTRKEN
jgi:hypothetical protein